MVTKQSALEHRPCQHMTSQLRGGLAVVTVGNALRGDDGAAEAACRDLAGIPGLCLFNLGCYTSQIIDCLSGHEAAVIIDATESGAEPGTITTIDLDPIIRERASLKLHSCHGFSIIDELQLARWKGILPRRMYFIGIEVANTDWGEGLSQPVEASIPAVVAAVERLADALAAGGSRA